MQVKRGQIEEDREALRKNLKQQVPFSYIPFLKKVKCGREKVKIRNLSTHKVLVYLEESFQNSNKDVLKKLEKIRGKLLERKDLFQSILEYLEGKKGRDEMFYWAPGYKISNIFCFIVDLLPEFVQQYKEYYIEGIVCGKRLYDARDFIKERYPGEYEQFKLMGMDLAIFKRCISAGYWGVETGSNSKEASEMLRRLEIPAKIEISEDIEAEIALKASFAEVCIDGEVRTISLEKLADVLGGWRS